MSQNESITGTEQSARYSLASRVVLLATDGTSTSAGAKHVAYALAQELGAGVHVVSVFDTRGVPIPSGIGGALQVAHEVVGQGVHTEQEHAVRGTLAATLGRDVDWPVRMSLGAPSSAIVREARRLDVLAPRKMAGRETHPAERRGEAFLGDRQPIAPRVVAQHVADHEQAAGHHARGRVRECQPLQIRRQVVQHVDQRDVAAERRQ